MIRQGEDKESMEKKINKVFYTLLIVIYLLYFIPTKPFYVTSYIPGWGGIPIFWWFWTIGNIVVCVLLGVWAYLRSRIEGDE